MLTWFKALSTEKSTDIYKISKYLKNSQRDKAQLNSNARWKA